MRSNKYRVTAWLLAGGVVIAIGSGAALVAKEADSPMAYKLKAAQTLQEQSAATQEAEDAFQKLTPAAQEKALAAIRAKAQQESNDMLKAAADAQAAQPLADPCPVQGVVDPLTPEVSRPFHAWEFVISDYWGGIVKGVCLGIYAGYDPANPLKGELVISDLTNGGPWQYYPTLTATGPVKIVAEASGELKLISLTGTYYTNPDAGPQKGIETPGNETYYFDLGTRQYR